MISTTVTNIANACNSDDILKEALPQTTLYFCCRIISQVVKVFFLSLVAPIKITVFFIKINCSAAVQALAEKMKNNPIQVCCTLLLWFYLRKLIKIHYNKSPHPKLLLSEADKNFAMLLIISLKLRAFVDELRASPWMITLKKDDDLVETEEEQANKQVLIDEINKLGITTKSSASAVILEDASKIFERELKLIALVNKIRTGPWIVHLEKESGLEETKKDQASKKGLIDILDKLGIKTKSFASTEGAVLNNSIISFSPYTNF